LASGQKIGNLISIFWHGSSRRRIKSKCCAQIFARRQYAQPVRSYKIQKGKKCTGCAIFYPVFASFVRLWHSQKKKKKRDTVRFDQVCKYFFTSAAATPISRKVFLSGKRVLQVQGL
jgi:hypothetical protein